MIVVSRKHRPSFWLVILAFLLIFNACRDRDDFYTGQVKLNFKVENKYTDTVFFDTVFTSPGPGIPRSFNRQMIVKNPTDQTIRTDIRLAGGEFSPFRVNVDGIPGVNFQDIEIYGGDSIFVFLEITADPNNDPESNPLIIRDSLVFNTNGSTQNVQLRAWGQDGQYFLKDTLCDLVWADQMKPYVVHDYIYVPEGCKLTIEEGVHVYMSPQAWIFVEGEIEIKGTASNPVYFEGDRLETRYDQAPGQWGGIWLSYPSTNNKITHLRAKNGIYGVVCDSVSSISGISNVIIKNCEFMNMFEAGVVGRGSDIYAENSVFVNNGEQGFRGLQGGKYDFRHCTFAAYSGITFNRRNPTFYATNRERDDFGFILRTFDIELSVRNSIIFGSLEDEAGFDIDGSRSAIGFYNNVIRTKDDGSFFNTTAGSGNVLNATSTSPMFRNYKSNDYHLDSNSRAIDVGVILVPPVPLDIEGNARDAQPDAGAYEYLK